MRSILIDARRDPAELRLKLGLTVSRARFAATIADGIFAPAVDKAVRSMSLRVLKTPVRAPQAYAHCDDHIPPWVLACRTNRPAERR